MVRSTSLTHGRQSLDAYSRIRALSATRATGRVAPRQTSQAFDAAGASGFAFLQSQLELIDADLVKPLQATTHARDITVKNGGGFPEFISAWASNYASTGTQFYGLQGTNNTDIPEAQIDIQKGIWPTFNWTAGFTITWIDLQRMEFAARSGTPAPFSLQELYEKSTATIWGKALDYVTYKGFLGNPGLINNPNVPAFYVNNGGSGTTWASKSPVQWLNDINEGINLCVINSGYDAAEACPDSLLLPYGQFALLTNPMTIGGIGYQSAIDYIVKNCMAAAFGIKLKIFMLPNDWISGTGQGGSDRGCLYRNSDDNVLLRVPTPMTKAMTVPTTKDGGAYQTMYAGNVSSVIFKRTTTQVYLDGI